MTTIGAVEVSPIERLRDDEREGAGGRPRAVLGLVRRVVLKVGTSTLTRGGATIDRQQLRAIAADVSAAMAQGRGVVLVSSGAIVTGAHALGRRRPRRLVDKQMLAAVGQPVLMQHYSAVFAEEGLRVAQVLLTRQDFEDRRRYVNARQAMLALLADRIVPIVNENDTVATDEIQIGDNDTLSALVASLIGADLLVVMSDVEGLMTADPRRTKAARLIPVVDRITAAIVQAGGEKAGGQGVGGMATKIAAARIATASGVATVVADGGRSRLLSRLLDGEQHGTVFLPSGRPTARRRWLAFGLVTRGTIVIDDRAAEALRRGRSLLAVGMVRVDGTFAPGDAVLIQDVRGQDVARALVNYSSGDLAKIQGVRSLDIGARLGRPVRGEVAHRDNLVIVEAE